MQLASKSSSLISCIIHGCSQPISLSFNDALYPLGPVATLRFCHLRPGCVSKQRRTTNVIISDRVWWIWCDAGLATVATRPQRSPHSGCFLMQTKQTERTEQTEQNQSYETCLVYLVRLLPVTDKHLRTSTMQST